MGIIENLEVVILEPDLTESQIMSDLMTDFPPISREYPPEVLAEYVAQYLKDTGTTIAWDQTPLKDDVPLKIVRRKRNQAEYDEEEEVPKKQVNKEKASKFVASGIQKKLAELGLAQIYPKELEVKVLILLYLLKLLMT